MLLLSIFGKSMEKPPANNFVSTCNHSICLTEQIQLSLNYGRRRGVSRPAPAQGEHTPSSAPLSPVASFVLNVMFSLANI